MKRIINWLNTPYYFNPSLLFKVKTSLTLGTFVFIFLYVFKPFSLTSFGNYLLEYTAAIGIFGSLASFLVLFIPPLLLPDYFNEDKWTIGKNLLLIFIAFVFIGFVLWYATGIYKDKKELERISLPTFMYYTFLVGAIPVFFSIYINEKNLSRKRKKRVKEIKNYKEKKRLEKEKVFTSDITIYSDNKKENICFHIKDLVYITSQGNYASFFIKKEDDTLQERILRVTLTKIEKELEGFTKVIRCHKSYIINTNYVNDISGNARGYLLESDIIEFQIPVSRSFSKQSLMSFLD
ncbi:LytTR family transcriptional regulator DNA-binding domain-containing protein [Polaribacter sp. R77954]|uniref:LytTR family transcriptional regulator DNA-binding domain-containing protein n=1 Tax=Polaribacter sp. R77954 TaxID=3093870 RepID=UPI0037C76381